MLPPCPSRGSLSRPPTQRLIPAWPIRAGGGGTCGSDALCPPQHHSPFHQPSYGPARWPLNENLRLVEDGLPGARSSPSALVHHRRPERRLPLALGSTSHGGCSSRATASTRRSSPSTSEHGRADERPSECADLSAVLRFGPGPGGAAEYRRRSGTPRRFAANCHHLRGSGPPGTGHSYLALATGRAGAAGQTCRPHQSHPAGRSRQGRRLAFCRRLMAKIDP